MPSSYFHVLFLGLTSLIGIWFLYSTSVEVKDTLSPQGCRMSWMSPSYIPQNIFDTSWSPLARRYSLWLYREAGWEVNKVFISLQMAAAQLSSRQLHRGIPVLFIPGNAGSSRQARSIASSAARQFFTSPFTPDIQFEQRELKPLDIFTGPSSVSCQTSSLTFPFSRV
jgi:GPI inositol-deacylase